MSEQRNWWVTKERVRTDYVRIQNLAKFMGDEVPYVHPDHPMYSKFWSKEAKTCIEGVWSKEWGKYRYMPGNLYYFGKYGVIEHTHEKNGVKVTEDIKPLIVDYLWDMAYMSITAYGFSGFIKDDKYSCHILLKLHEENLIPRAALPKQCIRKDGSIKIYKEAYEYLLNLHDEDYGKALYQNPTQNVLVMGSRGGTKSYWVAIAELEYNFVFGGARRYDKQFIENRLRCQQCVGAADVSKSSELLKKFADSRDAKADYDNETFRKRFGIWQDTNVKGEASVTPCPFYRRALGSLDCPNKKPNRIFRAKYKIDSNGEWKEKGTGSQIAHVNFSPIKPNGERSAEGGRYLFIDIEEVGSAPNFVKILGANEGTVTRAGQRIGVQWAQGTSGNIEYVKSAKKVMLKPESYNIIGFKNQFGGSHGEKKTGYFIPYYITLLEFKDKNGNTDYDAAIAKTNLDRADVAKSDDPRVLDDFLMNKPCYLDEMWITGKGHYLPVEEASSRVKQLLTNDLYKALMKPVKLVYDSSYAYGVRADVDHDAQPYIDFPHDPNKAVDPSGCIVIYEDPIYEKGKIPKDLYIFSLDPYVEEDIDAGGSIAAAYVLINPKYISKGYNGNTVVATYIGKPIAGLDAYYENLYKLMLYYGAFDANLWYEKNRGERVREFWLRKNALNMLAPTPQVAVGDSQKVKMITSFGYVVGNRISKLNYLKMLNDWLLDETELNDGTKTNIERIPCLYTCRQIEQYEIDGNYDAVDGLRGVVLGVREINAILEARETTKKTRKHFDALLKNNRIFSQAYMERRIPTTLSSSRSTNYSSQRVQ